LEVLGALIASLGKVRIGNQEHYLQGECKNDLCIVNETMRGLKLETLVDNSETHFVVSEQNGKGIHHHPKSSMALFKVMNLILNPTRVVVIHL